MLDPGGERKYMTDIEILDKYTNLNKSCPQMQKRIRLWTYYINTKIHSV